MEKFDIHPFLRDCYLHAEPSIDIDKADNVKASAHKIKLSVYNELKEKYEVKDENLSFAIDWYMMDKGPTWVDDTKVA